MWRLVDHQPHPAVRRDLVADADHQVLRQPVRLELAAVGLGRPRRVEAGALDGVDGRQVGERIGSIRTIHRGSRDHATSPASARYAARQGDVLGDERGQVVAGPVGRSRAAPSRISAAPSPARAASPRSTAVGVGARPSRSIATSVSPARQLRLRAGRPAAPAAARAGRRSGRTVRPAGGRPGGRRSRPSPIAAASRASAVETPTIGMPRPWARPLAVAMPDAQPGERARARPDDDADQPRAPDVPLAEDPADRRQQRLAVTVAGRPGREPVDPARRATRWRRPPASSRSRCARMARPPPVVGRAAHGTASR